jgi:hypothetical protein
MVACRCLCLRPTHRECLRAHHGSQAAVVDHCNVRWHMCSQVGTSMRRARLLQCFTSAVADDPVETSEHWSDRDTVLRAFRWYAKCSLDGAYAPEPLYKRASTLGDAENWLALGTGALLLLVGASRRSAVGACLAVSSVPLLHRGITGRWPTVMNGYGRADDSRTALAGSAGIHVRESIRLEVPLEHCVNSRTPGSP